MTSPADRALAHVRTLFPAPGPAVLDAPITVNFHPDRLLPDGSTVAQRLAAGGVYRSQFETGISNGGLTAYAGGERDRWEQRMFAGAYAGLVRGRPVYGALNLAGHPDGAAPRFGSCHLVLDVSVSARATFSHGDSVTEPRVVGTADTFGAVWQALLDEVAGTGRALHVAADSPNAWAAALRKPRTAAGRVMDGYVEAQVHGGVTLSEDVTAVVADPSFRGTPTGALLRGLSPRLLWSPGFELPADAFPEDLRGPDTPRIAAAVAAHFGRDVVDAELVGRATHEPGRWAAFGSPPEVLQLLKYVWHVLVLRGAPACP
ncbi:DUF3626 domain-containing protein [Actinoplanes sp. URMC 104]|uniref:DUF3626 domain-containing protein n=1 Tax=Actinoplanes sp. URMC 104 TaxID=3423409 RepID=UPI003F1B0DAF